MQNFTYHNSIPIINTAIKTYKLLRHYQSYVKHIIINTNIESSFLCYLHLLDSQAKGAGRQFVPFI